MNNIITSENNEDFYVNDNLILSFNRITFQTIVYTPDNPGGILLDDKQIIAQQLLQTHLQYFTKYGMNPDELIFI